MKFLKDREDAVSPVIGVILMVAITVILAAVIAAFVFGMAGSVKKTYNVAATAAQTGANNILITYNGGADANEVAALSYAILPGGTGTLIEGTLSTNVGAVLSSTSGTGDKDHVTVTAIFNDGTKQVILDTNV
ncbi:MAG: type IV pilin N-terminal domain-containing protein [Methanomicrobiales archaeon]|nr:type IV pilin N-terminal domain-containing protein [Methanomicrobiales archaeon]